MSGKNYEVGKRREGLVHVGVVGGTISGNDWSSWKRAKHLPRPFSSGQTERRGRRGTAKHPNVACVATRRRHVATAPTPVEDRWISWMSMMPSWVSLFLPKVKLTLSFYRFYSYWRHWNVQCRYIIFIINYYLVGVVVNKKIYHKTLKSFISPSWNNRIYTLFRIILDKSLWYTIIFI